MVRATSSFPTPLSPWISTVAFVGAATGQEGLALAEREAPDLVLLDVKMPGMDGLEVLERLRSMNETLPVVVISGHGTISTAVEATKKGAFDFIEKPFASERVLVSLRNALDQGRLRDENRSLKRAVEVRHQMIGDSAGLKQVMAAVGRAAPTNATVLIQGESGVGKELVARTIHRNSLRSRERFVQVNCAAIPEELIESVGEFRRIARAARPGDILTLYIYAPDVDQRQLKTIRVDER